MGGKKEQINVQRTDYKFGGKNWQLSFPPLTNINFTNIKKLNIKKIIKVENGYLYTYHLPYDYICKLHM